MNILFRVCFVVVVCLFNHTNPFRAKKWRPTRTPYNLKLNLFKTDRPPTKVSHTKFNKTIMICIVVFPCQQLQKQQQQRRRCKAERQWRRLAAASSSSSTSSYGMCVFCWPRIEKNQHSPVSKTNKIKQTIHKHYSNYNNNHHYDHNNKIITATVLLQQSSLTHSMTIMYTKERTGSAKGEKNK